MQETNYALFPIPRPSLTPGVICLFGLGLSSPEPWLECTCLGT